MQQARRLRISLRTLLVLVLFLSLPLAWLGMQLQRTQEQRQAVRKLQALGAACFFDYQMSTAKAVPRRRPIGAPATPRYRRWSEQFLGEHIWDRVVLVEFYPWKVDDEARDRLVMMGTDRQVHWATGLPEVHQGERQPKQAEKTALLPRRLIEPAAGKPQAQPETLRFGDDDMALLTQLPHLESWNLGHTFVTDVGLSQLVGPRTLTELRLQGTDVGDSGLKHVGKLTQLRELHLNYTQVTDAGLAHVRQLKNLETRLIWGTQVGDTGIARLTSLKQLRVLILFETQVSDEGIAHLESMPSLEHVDIRRTRVTRVGHRSLKEALPNCTVEPEYW